MGIDYVPGTELGVDHVQLTAGPATRLSWRGWLVDVYPSGAITVPEQTAADKAITDLNTLLVTAYARTGTPIHHGYSADPAQWAAHSATTDRSQIRGDAIAALRAGRGIAQQLWSPRKFSVYACAEHGWRQTEMRAPYAVIMAALRAALPPHMTLGYYNDHAPSRRAIPDLFAAAIGHLTGSPSPRVRHPNTDSRATRIA